MKKHSPAPWIFDDAEPAIYDYNGDLIADLEMFTQHNVEMPCNANGYLMAAAPMLVTAIQWLMAAKTGEELKEARRYANIVLLNARGFANDDE